VSITDDAAAATQSTATRGKGKGTDAGGGARGPQATESEDTDGEVAHFHVRSFQSRHNASGRPTLRPPELARHAPLSRRMNWREAKTPAPVSGTAHQLHTQVSRPGDAPGAVRSASESKKVMHRVAILRGFEGTCRPGLARVRNVSRLGPSTNPNPISAQKARRATPTSRAAKNR